MGDQLIAVEPPPIRRGRARSVGAAQVPSALDIMRRRKWVTDGKCYGSRSSAVWRTDCLIDALVSAGQKRSELTRRVWHEGGKSGGWRWAVRKQRL